MNTMSKILLTQFRVYSTPDGDFRHGLVFNFDDLEDARDCMAREKEINPWRRRRLTRVIEEVIEEDD